jgi:hypothetical protein
LSIGASSLFNFDKVIELIAAVERGEIVVSTIEKMAPGFAPRALCIRRAAGRHSRRRRALRQETLRGARA